MKLFSLFIIIAGALVGAATSLATQYYVATNGNDSAAGTLAAPWQTIQKAADTLQPGDAALVRGGVYNEAVTVNVSGSAAGGYVTFQSYPGETAIVDGTGLPFPPQDNYGLFLITDQSYVAIQGFEIRNYQTNDSTGNYVPAGIWISGASYGITIVSNRIHDIVDTNADGNAYGMEVWGDSATQTITNVVVQGNELYNLQTGQSESFSLDGNVSGFNISGNFVHDNNNIAIGFIGYEGVCPTASLDYARNGVCRSNVVWNISGINNAGEGYSYDADGIYSDGGSNVLIELNLVYNCDIGVEMASEHKGHAANACLCRDNLIWSNNSQGISIGGYSTSVGQTLNCIITHNTLYHNDSQMQGYGELFVQYYAVSNVFKDNILVANAQNLFIGNPFTQNTNNAFDWNLYYAPTSANASTWQWKKKNYTTLAAYQAATTNDAHSLFADPLFINAAQTNFHLSFNSPAVNAGDPNFVAAPGETDIDGQPRVAGGRTDIGADELNVLAPTLAAALLAPGELLLQLSGEPGHPFVLQSSAAFMGWLPFFTNYTGANGLLAVTNSPAAAAGFFRAQMVQ